MSQRTPPDDVRVEPFPLRRRAVVDAVTMGHRRNTVHGLVEFDVTEARRRIRAHEAATGEDLSFTAFVVHCFATALAEHPEVQAYRDWRGRLVVFETVDVTLLVESEVGGTQTGVPFVVRDASSESVESITAAIRERQREPDTTQRAWWLPWLLRLPGVVRRQVYRLPYLLPQRWRETAGTACVTSVGMFGSGGGWGIPITNYPAQLTVGGIAARPALVDGSVEARECLAVTVSVDHDTVDGAPAARFAERLRSLMESADGLPTPAPASVAEPT
jgi:pyruvate/2-oxoglutarate dehydrogenase complex dihydrolipoamide acyltransferase (E2) component